MRPSWTKVPALPHISSKWPGRRVTFDILSVDATTEERRRYRRRCRSDDEVGSMRDDFS